MFKSLKERAQARRADSNLKKENKESGVSGIIELVIVLVILGILTAILLPTFLSTTSTAKNKSVEGTLANAVTDAASYYATNGAAFDTAAGVGTSIHNSEPAITAVVASATPVTTINTVTVQYISASQVILGTYSLGLNNGQGGCIYASVNNSNVLVSSGITTLSGESYFGTPTPGQGCQIIGTGGLPLTMTFLSTMP